MQTAACFRAAAPRPDADLMFGRLGETADPFNSPKYQVARRHFAGFRTENGPFCAGCTWPRETAQIDRNAFSADTVQRLTAFSSLVSQSLRGIHT